VFFDVPLDVCMQRNRGRNRVVPDEAMRDMAARLAPPSLDEGFNKITVPPWGGAPAPQPAPRPASPS